MFHENFNHGFDPEDWEAAKREARAVLYDVARKRRTIAYSELAAKIRSVRMDAHDPRLGPFLGEISYEDDHAGLGLTTVLVVHKYGDFRPGPGFFELANSLGRDTEDLEKCWIDELNAVYDHWRKR